jgi:uncharacterized protein (DUF2345 family)
MSKGSVRANGYGSRVAFALNADVRQLRIGSGKRGEKDNRQPHTQKLLQPHLNLSSRFGISAGTRRGLKVHD